jgi:type IX secretion system PorP/SprF family membrane protein
MLSKPLKYFVFILLATSLPLFSQYQVIKYPVRFSQYYNSYQIINPSFTGTYHFIDVSVGDKHQLGDLNKISTYYLSASARLDSKKKSRNSSFSALGLFVYNDHEGKYLNRTRFYASYAWHGNITHKIKVSGGFHMGAMSYSVKGTPLTGDGSDIAPDGAVGVQVYRKDFHFGFSYNQIFNNSIQPLEEIAKLSPYLNFEGSINFNTGSFVILTPSYSIRIPVIDNKNLFDITLMARFKQNIAFIIGIHDNNKMMNTVEIQSVLKNKSQLNFSITYCYPLLEETINTNFIEFGIQLAK